MPLGNVSKRFLFVIFIFCSLPIGAIAETTMHCGMRLVEVGDKKAEVLDTCGEPLIRDIIGDKTAWTERKHQGKVVKGTAMTISVERWTYSFGPNRFSRILTFYGDELVKIELGEKLKR